MFSSQNSQVSNDVNYIEDVFNSYLWTTSASDQTLTTGIDMTKGALTWIKSRSNTFSHVLQTGIGGGVLPNNALSSNNTNAYFGGNYRIAESTTGFTMGPDYYTGTPETAVVWTFRKQAKFFDIQTWSGNGTIGRTISHSLGSVPGCIIVKKTNSAGSSDWVVYHRSLGATKAMLLNLTDSVYTWNVWNDTAPTSTVFSLNDASEVNGVGNSYVAYLFAHNAGGFGLTGTDNVISCGSFTDTTTVNLGYEPQWVLFKKSSSSSIGDWFIADNMRGFSETSINTLSANTSSAEASYSNTGCVLTSTGFTYNTGLAGSGAFIYIAIRRGPMKVPTSGTTVFTPITYNGNGTSQTITGSVGVPDLGLGIGRTGGAAGSNAWYDRLRGKELALRSTTTSAQYDASPGGEGTMTNVMNGMRVENTYGILNDASTAYILYFMSRAPSFFDEVCYTGTGTAGRTINHNLGVTPELIITKERSAGSYWYVYSAATGPTQYLRLESTNAPFTYSGVWNDTAPTSSVFTVGSDGYINASGQTFVAYLFATCAGVSKCTAFTGTGTLQTINCGFTSGARFVLIKRTDSTGDWYVWDSARGISSSTDPYLLLNSTAAEVTSTNWVDTTSTGFQVTAASGNNVNINGASYIALAIA